MSGGVFVTAAGRAMPLEDALSQAITEIRTVCRRRFDSDDLGEFEFVVASLERIRDTAHVDVRVGGGVAA